METLTSAQQQLICLHLTSVTVQCSEVYIHLYITIMYTYIIIAVYSLAKARVYGSAIHSNLSHIELLILEKWVLVNKCEETIDIHLSRDES